MDLPVAIGLAATVGPAVVGGFVWLIRSETRGDVTRLDGRLDRYEAVNQALRGAEIDWKNDLFKHLALRDAALDKRLDKIDDKLDKALGID